MARPNPPGNLISHVIGENPVKVVVASMIIRQIWNIYLDNGGFLRPEIVA